MPMKPVYDLMNALSMVVHGILTIASTSEICCLSSLETTCERARIHERSWPVEVAAEAIDLLGLN